MANASGGFDDEERPSRSGDTEALKDPDRAWINIHEAYRRAKRNLTVWSSIAILTSLGTWISDDDGVPVPGSGNALEFPVWFAVSATLLTASVMGVSFWRERSRLPRNELLFGKAQESLSETFAAIHEQASKLKRTLFKSREVIENSEIKIKNINDDFDEVLRIPETSVIKDSYIVLEESEVASQMLENLVRGDNSSISVPNILGSEIDAIEYEGIKELIEPEKNSLIDSIMRNENKDNVDEHFDYLISRVKNAIFEIQRGSRTYKSIKGSISSLSNFALNNPSEARREVLEEFNSIVRQSDYFIENKRGLLEISENEVGKRLDSISNTISGLGKYHKSITRRERVYDIFMDRLLPWGLLTIAWFLALYSYNRPPPDFLCVREASAATTHIQVGQSLELLISPAGAAQEANVDCNTAGPTNELDTP